MRLKEDIRPLTFMKTRATELLDQVNASHRPIVITQNGEARAVVLDVESYESLRDASSILQLAAHSEAAIQAGAFLPQREVFSRVRSRLARK